VKIPRIVLDILARPWPWRDVYYGESAGPADLVTNRYECTRRGKTYGLTYPEVQALVAEDVLTPIHDDGRSIDIDAQEQVALQFFFGEVNFAWASYEKRLARIRAQREQAAKRQAWEDAREAESNRQLAGMPRNISNFTKRRA
jgi:hypothetical protein